MGSQDRHGSGVPGLLRERHVRWPCTRIDGPPAIGLNIGMCNEYEQVVAWSQYCQMMQHLELGIPAEQGEADLPEATSIRISDTGPVMRASGNVVELVPMRFGFPPARPKAGPVF